jgi:hypothetical protein
MHDSSHIHPLTIRNAGGRSKLDIHGLISAVHLDACPTGLGYPRKDGREVLEGHTSLWGEMNCVNM